MATPTPTPTPEAPGPADVRAVEAMFGRSSIVDFRVAVRCPAGGPAVLEDRPRDRRGRPFPTRNWLACRALGDAVSRLEAADGVRALEDDPVMASALAGAQAEHARRHDGHLIAGAGDAAHVKCLHAHLAFALACGGGPIADWIGDRADLAWPERCCSEAEDEDDR